MLSRTFFLVIANFAFLCSNIAEAQSETSEPSRETHFLQLALDCVDREYPNKISHVLQSDSDARTPRDLHPAFYGCYDWHSAVHGHWLIVRLLRGGLDEAADAACESAYAALSEAGLDPLYDDTKERPGGKFATADLIGLPYQLVIGPRGLKENKVEVKVRRSGETHELSPQDAVARLAERAFSNG